MSFHEVAYGPRVVSGPGSLAHLGELASDLAGTGVPVLLVADSGLEAPGLIGRAAGALRAAGSTVAVYGEIAGEPREAQIEAARRLGRLAGAQLVVCLGGGSALDAGKLAAALLATQEPVGTFRLAATPLPAKSVPTICIPTTAGTGSEMTGISIVSDENKIKNWFWGAALEADLALLDPELTTGLPAGFTAMTGMDALVHAMEAATNRNATPESDRAAYQAISLVVEHLPRAVAEPNNIEARAGMLDGAALAGLAIHKAGTALAHNIGHALGSLAPVPHGLAVTLAMAATVDWVLEGNRPAFARVAEAMGLGTEPDSVPGAFRRLASTIGLKLDARQVAPGVTQEALAARMAEPENAAMRQSTVRAVRDEDLLPLAHATMALGADRPFTGMPIGPREKSGFST